MVGHRGVYIKAEYGQQRRHYIKAEYGQQRRHMLQEWADMNLPP
jgi:hypothetical protein